MTYPRVIWGCAPAPGEHCSASTATARAAQVPWCQPGFCGAAGLGTGTGDGRKEDGMCFGSEGRALCRKTLALCMLLSRWEHGPVVVRALGGGDGYPWRGHAVDLACDFGQGCSPLCTCPQ